MVDIKRQGVARRRRLKWTAYSIVLAAAVGMAGWRVSKLEPAALSVERGTLIIDTVKRGEIVIDRRGLGTLVPDEIVWIPAAFNSQVSKLLVKSGERVRPNTVVMTLSNPDMEVEANNLEWQLRQAEANYSNLKVTLESQRLNQEANVATVKSDLAQALLAKDRDEQLLKYQLKSELEVKLTVAKWEQLSNKYEIEKKRLEIMQESTAAQLEAQKVQIETLRNSWQLKKRQVAELTIRAGVDGVVQEMTLQVGQRVTPGAILAKVAQPGKLRAELKIAETQAKDIVVGQKASIDTRNGIIPARVSRIDPNVVNGTRTIDCRLEGTLPAGAVPDLSVDGTVEIDRMNEVLYVGRPTFGQEFSQVSLFKLTADGKNAVRVPVKLGRSSVNVIQVLEGLNVGDQVILSDMSAQDQVNRIRLD
jgi:HlyD family secretion protein